MEGEMIIIQGMQLSLQSAKLTKDMLAAIIKALTRLAAQAKRTPAGEVKLNKMLTCGEPLAVGTVPMDRAYEFGQLAKNDYGIMFCSVDYADQNMTDFLIKSSDVPKFNSIIEHMGIVKESNMIDGIELEKSPERESTREKLENFAARGQTEPPQLRINGMEIGEVLQAKERVESGDIENRTSSDWRVVLELAATDYQYSKDNQDLIRERRPDATIVKSKTRWAELGRMVPDDAPQIAIRQPLDDTGLNFQDIAVFDFTDTVKSDRAIPRAKNDSMKALIAQLQEKYAFEVSDNIEQDVFFDPAQNKILYKSGLPRDDFFLGAQREASMANSFRFQGAANFERADNLLRAESVAYAACIKCGVNPKGIDFKYMKKMDKDLLKAELPSIQKSISGLLRSEAMRAIQKTTFKSRESMEMVK